MPDLEPASALLMRLQTATLGEGRALIESDRASVREPLERRVRELTARANELPGLSATLDEHRFFAALVRDSLSEPDPGNALGRIRVALRAIEGRGECPDTLLRARERLASLEAQLASARDTLWRLREWSDTFGKDLVPRGPDTYGEGVRACKETVKRMLSTSLIRPARLRLELARALRAVKLFVVTAHDHWGYSVNVVRAESAEVAHGLCSEKPYPSPRVEVEELRDGAGILWSYEESPDSPRD